MNLSHFFRRRVCNAGFPVCGFGGLSRLRGTPERRSGAKAASPPVSEAPAKHGTGKFREPADRNVDRNVCATSITLIAMRDLRTRAATHPGFDASHIQGRGITRWLGIAAPLLIPAVFLLSWLLIILG
jgi:hypothetical protein